MRTTDGQQRVDVIYRRIDDEFLDPVHFRPDSVIGCAGVLNAARAGRVTIANAVGNGVADDKLLYTYVPDLIRYYLGEEPMPANVDTYRLDERGRPCEWVLDSPRRAGAQAGRRLGRQGHRHRAAGRRGDAGRRSRSRCGPTRAAGSRRSRSALSTVPDAGRRPDRAAGTSTCGRSRSTTATNVWVLPGGLTRVALPEGELVVNSSQGGGSKDTWVISPPRQAAESRSRDLTRIEFTAADLPDEPPAQDPGPLNDTVVGQSQQQQQQTGPVMHREGAVLSRIAESLFWIGRYVERADDTARILDVHTQRLVEDPWIDERRACANLLALMGSPTPEARGRHRAGARPRSAFDRTSPSSIVGALSAARENARGAREVLSAEIWESLNVTHNALPQQRTMARAVRPALAVPVRPRAVGDGVRPRRRHDEPRRELAVPHPRPLASSGST